jgi:hypothetical protein
MWLGPVGVALGTAISHILFVVIIMPHFVCPQLHLRRSQYLMSAYLRPAMAGVPLTAVALVWRVSMQVDNLVGFVVVVALLMVNYAISVYFVGLERNERNMLTQRITSYLARRR